MLFGDKISLYYLSFIASIVKKSRVPSSAREESSNVSVVWSLPFKDQTALMMSFTSSS